MTVREKLVQTAKNVPKVFAAGKTAECNRFWDGFKETALASYTHKYLFAGAGWNDNTFSPTFSISPNNVEQFFRECKIVDLAGILEKNGVVFDFSNAVNCDSFAYQSTIIRFPFLDFANASRLSNCFAYLRGEDVHISLNISDSGNQKITSLFDNSPGLTELRLTGTVGQDGLNLQWSTKLSKASIESVVNALSDTAAGKTVTFSKTAKEAAFTAEEWAALIATKPNWTISLA